MSARAIIEATARVSVWRGVNGGDPRQPRDGYQLTFSSRKEVADSYVRDGEAQPFTLEGEFVEFPTQEGEFSKLGFDRAVQSLRPGQILVARGVYDTGPWASVERDPQQLFSYRSDIYATRDPGTIAESVTLRMIEAAGRDGVLIFRLSGNSAGSHGFDGGEETPARNPIYSAFVETEITPEEERQLIGLPCSIVPLFVGGSYHERWITLDAYVRVPVDHPLADRAESLPEINPRRILKWPLEGSMQFPFAGVHDAVTRIRAACNADPEEFSGDSETWWGKEIEVEKMRQPRTYDGD